MDAQPVHDGEVAVTGPGAVVIQLGHRERQLGLGRVDVSGQLRHRRPIGLQGLDVWEGGGRGDHCFSRTANMRSLSSVSFHQFQQTSLQTSLRRTSKIMEAVLQRGPDPHPAERVRRRQLRGPSAERCHETLIAGWAGTKSSRRRGGWPSMWPASGCGGSRRGNPRLRAWCCPTPASTSSGRPASRHSRRPRYRVRAIPGAGNHDRWRAIPPRQGTRRLQEAGGDRGDKVRLVVLL
jgi:hypothetical protein